MSRDMICLNCPLPDCLEGTPECLLEPKPESLEKENDKEIRSPLQPWGIEKTAERIGNSTDWIRKEIRKFRRGLPASIPRFFRVGNRYHWDPPDVEAWLEARKQGGAV
ncbi:MAG: hypothetical protein ACYCYP_08155 [Leptospirales bacterium]